MDDQGEKAVRRAMLMRWDKYSLLIALTRNTGRRASDRETVSSPGFSPLPNAESSAEGGALANWRHPDGWALYKVGDLLRVRKSRRFS
jgi:hypothetical protein